VATAFLEIDGATGEGGGQILRSALSLAAVSGRAVRIVRVRAGRAPPGLVAQHVTAARAVAAVCAGRLGGDRLGSQLVTLEPGAPPQAGDYVFDVAAARKGGSAGAVTLVLQAAALPLAFADGRSTLTLHGGTHMTWSPSFDYCREVWLPALAGMGIAAEAELHAWGWFPVGRGEVRAAVEGRGPGFRLRSVDLTRRGALVSVHGRAVAANLPAHIPQRMADRARALLAQSGIAADIVPVRVTAACPGAGLFLTARYEAARAGVSAHGKRGKASETVAEEAVAALLAHHRSGAGVDSHLADQLVLPAALAAGESRYTVAAATRHLETMAWLVERFGLARVARAPNPDGAGELVSVRPQSSQE
jgi:RNA 3'-terminal phosphate cyclase (ATP)